LLAVFSFQNVCEYFVAEMRDLYFDPVGVVATRVHWLWVS